MAPRAPQKGPRAIPKNRRQEPPRARQEALKRPSEGFRVEDAIPEPFWIDFDLHKESPEPQKSLKNIEKTILFEEIVFSARVASWTRFWTLLASLSGAFWPPRWLKPVLEFLLERPRAVQDYFFRPQERPKRRPRASHKPLEAPPLPTKPL